MEYSTKKNTIYLSTTFEIIDITKPNVVTKSLQLNIKDLIKISLPIYNVARGCNVPMARYINIVNLNNGKTIRNMSLNVFAKMINNNFILREYGTSSSE